MHYTLEVVVPPSASIPDDLKTILAPFDENADGAYRPFWDYWLVGGRWSGRKLIAGLPEGRYEAFQDMLKERGVTVSGLVWGKQELSPASQIGEVDQLWHEWFPDCPQKSCPLFRHSGDTMPMDVCTLAEVPASLTCSRVIFAAPSWNSETEQHDGQLKAAEMLEDEWWNGCSHVKAAWDGRFASAIEWMHAKMEHRSEAWKAIATPQDDWLVVTVDYHS